MARKFTVLLSTLFLIMSLTACTYGENEVLSSLGEYSTLGYYSEGVLQDFTDYGKYSYSSPDFDENKYFQLINDELKMELNTHLEDFEEWVNLFRKDGYDSSLSENYDFDSSVISDSDYVYIYENPDYPDLGYYDVYFFDWETGLMYYFHNNI